MLKYRVNSNSVNASKPALSNRYAPETTSHVFTRSLKCLGRIKVELMNIKHSGFLGKVTKEDFKEKSLMLEGKLLTGEQLLEEAVCSTPEDFQSMYKDKCLNIF